MARRSLLVVAQLAPPSSLVAARRVAGLTKYLGRLGWRITLLSSAISGEGPVEGAEEVVRTRDLMSTRLNWRRGHFAALTGGRQETYARRSRLEAVVVPDLAALTWVPIALPKALRLARRRSYDAVLTTSPPPSGHAVGYALRRQGVPWIAELRDGWAFEPPHPPWPLRPQRAADRILEERLLKRADAVVAVTEPIVRDLRERLGIEGHLITNGFDPEEQGLPDGNEPLLDPEKHSFVHTGRMALAGVDPRPLLDAVRILRAREPSIAAEIELVFAGPLSAEEQGLLTAPDLAGIVRTTGALERARTLELQREAGTLVVVTGGAARRSVATGKLFEYLAAGRPILVLGEETEAARIVRETRGGLVAPAARPEPIAEALKGAVEQPMPAADSAAVARYAYPAIAAEYDALLERVRRP